MKKKIRIKQLPKAQFGNVPPVVLTPEQQKIWEANQDMFGYYVNDSEKSAPQGMITPGLPTGTPLEMAPASIPNSSNPFAPYRSQLLETPITSVTPLLGDVDKFNEPYGPLKSSDYYANVAQQNIAAPFGTTFDENNAYAPNFQENKTEIDTRALQFLGQVPFIASGVFANMGKKRAQQQAEDQFRNRFLSDSLYTTIPEGYSGNRGDYTLNYGTGLNFRPDEAVYGQFGKVAQYGGEMKRKIKITGLPSAAYGGTQNASAIDEMYPYNSNVRRAEYSNMLEGPGEGSVKQYAEEVPREIANIEAERGETIVKPSEDGLLNMYKIGGKRHSEGGTPLQAGPGDFIFSDTREMKIKDPAILESFGMTYKKGGYTPAKISKKFNLNDPNIQKTLNDPKADLIARTTAERMFDNNLSQLGKLALVQEARKGFPQGAPGISMPYMQKVGLDPSMFMPDVMTPQDASVQMGKAQLGYEKQLTENINGNDWWSMGDPNKFKEEQYNKFVTGFNKLAPWAYKSFGDYASNAFGFLPSSINYLVTGNYEYPSQTLERWETDGTRPNDRFLTQSLDGSLQPSSARPALGLTLDFIGSGIPGSSLTKQSIKYSAKAAPYVQKAVDIIAKELPSLTTTKAKAILYKKIAKEFGDDVAKAAASNFESLSNVTKALGVSGISSLGYIGSRYALTEDEKKMVEESPELIENFEVIPEVQIKAPSKVDTMSDPRMERAKKEFKTSLPPPSIPKSYNIDTSELEFYKYGGNLLKAQKGIEAKPKRNLRVAKDKNNKFGVYEINDNGKATLLFNTYLGEGITPGGENESWKGGPERLKEYINELQDKGVDLSNIKSAKDFQSVIYNYTLKNNPSSIENMWTKYGTTKELNKYPDLIPKLNKQGVKTVKSNEGYTLDFSGVDPNKKGEVLGMLEPLYDDEKIGTRTVSLDFNTPKTEAPVAQEPVITPKSPDAKKQDPVGSYTQQEIIPSAGRNVPSGYYPQDIINMGQTLSDRLGINKYMPYDVTLPQPALMDPTFYDPSRELAANAEMANLVTQNLGQFAGPQALSSRASQIQGTAARSAADVLGRYNNLNVGVANQFEQANKALINDFNVKRALAKADYYDKSTIANQQYDNSKRAANARFTQQATNAITNKSRTDLMNQLVNNYAVDPLTGRIIFTGGSGLTGQNTTPDLAAQYATMQAEFEKLPGFKDLSAKEKFDIISKNMPRQSSITRKDDLANLIMKALTGN